MTVVSPSMPHAVALVRRRFNDFKHLLPRTPDRRVSVSRTRRAFMARRWNMFPLCHGIRLCAKQVVPVVRRYCMQPRMARTRTFESLEHRRRPLVRRLLC